MCIHTFTSQVSTFLHLNLFLNYLDITDNLYPVLSCIYIQTSKVRQNLHDRSMYFFRTERKHILIPHRISSQICIDLQQLTWYYDYIHIYSQEKFPPKSTTTFYSSRISPGILSIFYPKSLSVYLSQTSVCVCFERESTRRAGTQISGIS